MKWTSSFSWHFWITVDRSTLWSFRKSAHCDWISPLLFLYTLRSLACSPGVFLIYLTLINAANRKGVVVERMKELPVVDELFCVYQRVQIFEEAQSQCTLFTETPQCREIVAVQYPDMFPLSLWVVHRILRCSNWIMRAWCYWRTIIYRLAAEYNKW